jgi:hypothetical protein
LAYVAVSRGQYDARVYADDKVRVWTARRRSPFTTIQAADRFMGSFVRHKTRGLRAEDERLDSLSERLGDE